MDQFGQGFSMRLDGPQSQVSTLLGTLCTLMLAIIVLAYAYQKMDVLMNRKSVDILSTVSELAFEETDLLTADHGLNFAIGFTAYNNEREWMLPPEYGELVFNSLSWGSHPNGTFYLERKRLQTHPCTKEELGLSEDKSGATFMPFVGNQL